jgi:hypothetical protein
VTPTSAAATGVGAIMSGKPGKKKNAKSSAKPVVRGTGRFQRARLQPIEADPRDDGVAGDGSGSNDGAVDDVSASAESKAPDPDSGGGATPSLGSEGTTASSSSAASSGSVVPGVVEALKDLIKFTGTQCVDKDPAEVSAFLSSWLESSQAETLTRLTAEAMTSKLAHRALCEIVYTLTKDNPAHPQRVCTAICCDILEKVTVKLKHIKHVRTLKNELFRSIYRDFDEDRHSGFDTFIQLTPYFEEARSLMVKVTRLENERKALEEAETTAEQRREMRKKVLSRTARRWQSLLISSVFFQWKETTQLVKAQRDRLKNYFRSMMMPSLSDIFHAWRSHVVNQRLKEALSSRKDQEELLALVEAELAACKETEKQLEAELSVMQKEVMTMQSKMVKTLNAIDAQKVQETMQVIEAVAKSLIATGDLVIAAIKPTIEDIASSPCLKKLAAVFYVREAEEATQAADAQAVVDQRRLTERILTQRKKRELSRKRKRGREKKALARRINSAKEKARAEAERLYRARISEAKEQGGHVVESPEELEKEQATAAELVETNIMDAAQRKWAADDEAEQVRIAASNADVLDQMRRQSLQHKERQYRTDASIPADKVDKALKELVGLSPDQLVLMWVAYHVRREVWNAFPYRRQCLNFREDLRDGTTYAVLVKKLAPELAGGVFKRLNLEEEIDPSVRIDAVLEVAAQLDPPATGFVTRGHILGSDTLLNAAFLIRLMLTHPRLEWHEEDTIMVKIRGFNDLLRRWEVSKEYIRKLSNWDTWVKLRGEIKAADLKNILRDIKTCVQEFQSIYTSLEEVSEEAKRARVVWWQISTRLRSFQWQLFSAKVLQQEEAPPGKDIDLVANHAPFRLVDYRHEMRLKEYTILQPSTLLPLLSTAWQLKGNPSDTFPEAALLADVPEMCKVLLANFDSLRRIFQHYAAGDDGSGNLMSLNEWWNFVRECRLSGDEHLSTAESQKIFQAIFEVCVRNTQAEQAARAAAHPELYGAEDATDGAGEHTESANAAAANAVAASAKGDAAGAELGYDGGDDDGDVDEDGDGNEEEADEEEFPASYWVHGIVTIAMARSYRSNTSPAACLAKTLADYVLPNACKSNTDSFRGEVSMDEVQNVFKAFRASLRKIFLHYAKTPELLPGQPSREPSLDIKSFMLMMQDSGVLTRKGDLRNDFPEESAKIVFQEVQLEEDSNTADVGGGDDEMIWMEFLEAVAAIACYKFVNPYIPLHSKLEDFLTNKLIPGQMQHALKRKKKSGK